MTRQRSANVGVICKKNESFVVHKNGLQEKGGRVKRKRRAFRGMSDLTENVGFWRTENPRRLSQKKESRWRTRIYKGK